MFVGYKHIISYSQFTNILSLRETDKRSDFLHSFCLNINYIEINEGEPNFVIFKPTDLGPLDFTMNRFAYKPNNLFYGMQSFFIFFSTFRIDLDIKVLYVLQCISGKFQLCRTIRRRSYVIIGFVAPAIGPNKSKKLTRLISPTHNIRGKV